MKILCLGAHPDDIELGAGGTISKLISEGNQVYGHAFTSDCLEYSLAGLHIEMISSFNHLGIIKPLEVRSNFAPRSLPRQEILEEMLILRKLYNPDIVFTHSSLDTHQDHQIIHEETFRAFKNTRILGYDMPWNNKISDNKTLFAKLEVADVENKLTAASFYKSQINRSAFNPEYIKSLMIVRGNQINTTYAEAFETIRWIL